MAAPTTAAGVKKTLANPEPSTHGPSRHFAAAQQSGRFQVEADNKWQVGPVGPVEYDPGCVKTQKFEARLERYS
jgi:hypothetical protein